MRAKIVSLRAFALTAGVAAMLGAGAANAADVVFEEPPAPAPILDPAPVSDWGGGYLGLSAGYGFFGTMNNTNAGQVRTNGIMFGGFGGVQGQSGRFVYGIEGDVGYNGAFGQVGGTATRAGVEGSLRGRVGVAATDSVLIYGTAGPSATQVRVFDAAGTDGGVQFGYTVGAGTDVKFTEKLFGRLEYRYTDNFARTYNTGSGAQSIDYNNHRVTVGLGVKF